MSAGLWVSLSLAACSGGGDDSLPTADAGQDAEALPDAAPSCPSSTRGPTMHEGDVLEDQVWRAEDGPHVVIRDLNVRSGARLTIEPCSVVQLASGVSVHVAYPGTPNRGELAALGDEARPIRFESLVEGEAWARIYVHAPGTLRLAHVTLRGGGGSGSTRGETIDMVGDGELPSDALLHVDHVTIDGSRGAGVWLHGLAKFSADSRDLTVVRSGSEAEPYPVVLTEHALDSLPSGAYTGNHDDRILVEHDPVGGLRESGTLHERGVPYRLGRLEAANGGLRVEALLDQPAVRLTIEPGVRLEFPKGSALEVGLATGDLPTTAILDARGSAERPIVFTSAAAAPALGDWRGLWFGARPSADNRLDHVRIEYTGASCGCIFLTCDVDVTDFSGALIFSQPPPSMFMTNSSILHGGANGVVQGYSGSEFDWTVSNEISVSGCKQTRPWSPNEPICPTPGPSCLR